MSLLKRINEFLFGKKIQHPFFGELLDAGSYYECKRLFSATETIVEIGLEKKTTGPDKKQIYFFKWLENDYDLIIDKISPRLTLEIKKLIPGYQIQDFKKEFILEYLFIPTAEQTPANWKISFYANNKLQHSCAFKMKGMEIESLLIDG